MLETLFMSLIALLAVLAGVWFIIRTIEQPVFGVGLLVFFLPFERIPSLDLAGLTLRINHVIGGLILLSWVLLLIAGRWRLRSAPAAPFLILFVGSLFLSLTAAQHFLRGATVTAITTIMIALALVIPQFLVRRDQLPKIVHLLLAGATVALFFGFYQFLGDLAGLPNTLTGLDPGYTKAIFGFPRIQALSQEPLYFGNYLLIPISLVLSLLIIPQRFVRRPVLIGLLITGLVAFGLTLSRGAFIGLAGSLLVMAPLLGKRLFTIRHLILATSGVVIASCIILIGLASIDPQAQSRFVSHITVQDFGHSESTSGRLESWFRALALWQTSPVIGIGPGNYGPASLDYPAEGPPRGWPIVNNEYFELLAETGLLGVTMFCLFLLLLGVRSWRSYQATRGDPELRALVVGLTAALVGMLLQYSFFSTLYITSIWITFGLLLAVQSIALEGITKNKERLPTGEAGIKN